MTLRNFPVHRLWQSCWNSWSQPNLCLLRCIKVQNRRICFQQIRLFHTWTARFRTFHQASQHSRQLCQFCTTVDCSTKHGCCANRQSCPNGSWIFVQAYNRWNWKDSIRNWDIATVSVTITTMTISCKVSEIMWTSTGGSTRKLHWSLQSIMWWRSVRNLPDPQTVSDIFAVLLPWRTTLTCSKMKLKLSVNALTLAN